MRTFDAERVATTRAKLALATGVVLGAVSWQGQSQAAVFTWDGSTDNGWATGTNWAGNAAPTSANTTDVVLTGTVNQAQSFNQGTGNANTTLHTVTFTQGGFNVVQQGNRSATLSGTGAGIISTGSNVWNVQTTLGAATEFLSNSGTLSIQGTVANGGNLLTVSGAGDTTISNVLSGAGGLAKNGAGVLTLSNASNTFSGPVVINAGTVSIANVANAGTNSSLGTGGTVTLGSASAATLRFTGSSGSTTRGLSIGGAGGATVEVTASGQTLTLSGGITGGGNAFSVTGAGNTTISTTGISGSGTTLTKTGAGTLTLGASNGYTGLTTLSAGTVTLTGSIGNGGLTVQGATLNGSGTVGSGAGAAVNFTSGSIAGATIHATTFSRTGSGTMSGGTVDVSSDYTNSGFGSGNSFAARSVASGVSGTAAINAEGTGQQTLTQSVGSGLSGGTGATPSISFGNVRAGTSNAQTVTLNWGGGAGGPTLRGAIQTGNLTTTPYNISGIASNTGADFVRAHGSSQNHTVNFNPSTGGNYNGTTFAIVNNFDNVQDQTVTLNGTAYSYAATNFAGTTVGFGIVHVGDAVSNQTFGVSNTATDGIYSDNLVAAFGTPSNAGILTGSSQSIGAGSSGNLSVGINTSSAGSRGGTVAVNLTSDGTSNGLDDQSLGSQTVTVTGQVNDYAAPVVDSAVFSDNVNGSFTGSGDTYTLDLGVIDQNAGTLSASVKLFNSISSFVDDLGGTWDLSGAGIFNVTDFTAFSGIAGGTRTGDFEVTLASNTVGAFNGSITLHHYGTNASGPTQYGTSVEEPIVINLIGEVSAVPEPGTLGLVGLGILGIAGSRRRRRL